MCLPHVWVEASGARTRECVASVNVCVLDAECVGVCFLVVCSREQDCGFAWPSVMPASWFRAFFCVGVCFYAQRHVCMRARRILYAWVR